MADHFDEGALAGSSLAPPPRAVPIRLRCQLLAGGATVWGSVIFGFASVLAFGLVSGMDPRGSLRLTRHRQEAPGRVLSERDTNYTEDGSTVRRHDYEFRLPDGTLLQGYSYSAGHRYLGFPQRRATSTRSAGRASPSNTPPPTRRPTASRGRGPTPSPTGSPSRSSSRPAP